MYDPDWSRYNIGSFREAVNPPHGLFDAAPTVCVEVASAWLPYIVGALSQLAQPSTWITDTDVALWDVLGRVQDLIEAVGTAGACMQAGTQPMDVSAGNAEAVIVVTFPQPFTVPPVVVVSESTGVLIASASSVSLTQFTLSITANVPTIVDMPSVVSWVARLAS